MTVIDRSIPIPAYYQIAMDIRHRIARGEWDAAMRLPPEPELAEYYNVSRMTMRQALAELVKDGIVMRRRGAGTFILRKEAAQPSLTVSLPLPMTVVRSLRELGYTPQAELVRSAVIPVPSATIAQALGIGEEEPVAFFQRVVRTNGRALVLARSMVPHRICPGITQEPLVDDSIQVTLAQRYGIVLREADHWIEAVRATDEDAAALGAGTGTPLLLLTSLFYADHHQPVEYVANLWMGDAMRIHLRVTAENAPTLAPKGLSDP